MDFFMKIPQLNGNREHLLLSSMIVYTFIGILFHILVYIYRVGMRWPSSTPAPSSCPRYPPLGISIRVEILLTQFAISFTWKLFFSCIQILAFSSFLSVKTENYTFYVYALDSTEFSSVFYRAWKILPGHFLFLLSIWAAGGSIKPTKWPLRPAKTQISLDIRTVWTESSLSAWRNIGSLATHYAHWETLIRLDGCPGWSESLLGAHVFLFVL